MTKTETETTPRRAGASAPVLALVSAAFVAAVVSLVALGLSAFAGSLGVRISPRTALVVGTLAWLPSVVFVAGRAVAVRREGRGPRVRRPGRVEPPLPFESESGSDVDELCTPAAG